MSDVATDPQPAVDERSVVALVLAVTGHIAEARGYCTSLSAWVLDSSSPPSPESVARQLAHITRAATNALDDLELVWKRVTA